MRSEKINQLDGYQFEQYCCYLLKKNGYHNVEITKKSGDYGIDILATKRGRKYAIQCKRYLSSVGNHAVQEAYSGKDFYNCDVAVVMTNSSFTPAAIETAQKLHVLLWDGTSLKRMKKFGLFIPHNPRPKKRRHKSKKKKKKRILLFSFIILLLIASILFVIYGQELSDIIAQNFHSVSEIFHGIKV